MPRLIHALLALLLLPFGAFAGGTAGDDYITNADEIVKAADWGNMKTITVEIEEHLYTPENIQLEAGQPYKLELKNIGEEKHYFTAPAFYKSIATRKVQSRDGEVKAPYFKALEVLVGGQLDLYFVPVLTGEFPVYCTIDDHREKGMEGTLVVR
ncbi:MAG: cupredoxin domain-containing protein [Gammaproteobacteria bacterium]|nr:cupredoxin domain-containing protein [Gammaproteobacteria bacterium]